MNDAPRRRPVQREWAGQQLYWVFLQKALPQGAMCRSVDEAAKRSRAANMRRAARGCLGGFGDIYIFWKSVTLWLEAKDRSGMRNRQESFRELILANGGRYEKVESVEDVEAACRAAGIPLRATLGEIRSRIAEQNERLPAKRKSSPRKAEPRFLANKRMTKTLNAG